jgi:hypothetical protein
MLDYVCGNLDVVQQSSVAPALKSSPNYHVHLLLAAGKPDEAVKVEGFDKVIDEWSATLAVSLAYSLAGNPTEADAWRMRACDKLREGDADQKRAASFLQRDDAPTSGELDEIVLRINDTPLFLATLAQRFPDHRTELNQRAQRLNISRQPQHLLVKKAVEQP